MQYAILKPRTSSITCCLSHRVCLQSLQEIAQAQDLALTLSAILRTSDLIPLHDTGWRYRSCSVPLEKVVDREDLLGNTIWSPKPVSESDWSTLTTIVYLGATCLSTVFVTPFSGLAPTPRSGKAKLDSIVRGSISIHTRGYPQVFSFNQIKKQPITGLLR